MAEHRLVVLTQRESRGHMHPPVTAVVGYPERNFGKPPDNSLSYIRFY